MTRLDPRPVLTEVTDQGEQVLVPGVAPVGLRERLERLLAAPLRPLKPQKPPQIALFDDGARNQLDLF
jgi:hypothetical protein